MNTDNRESSSVSFATKEMPHRSLEDVLSGITPLTTRARDHTATDHMERLTAAINTVLEGLGAESESVDTQYLNGLIDRISDLSVTGDNVEVQIGIAGDLRIEKGRLSIKEALTSLERIPSSMQPSAYRNGATALQKLLALLLLQGWTSEMPEGDERALARQHIVDTVQGL